MAGKKRRKKRGPYKRPDEKHEHPVRFNVTEETYGALVQATEAAGKKISGYLRDLVEARLKKDGWL